MAVSFTPAATPTDQPRQRESSGRVRSHTTRAIRTRLTWPCHSVPRTACTSSATNPSATLRRISRRSARQPSVVAQRQIVATSAANDTSIQSVFATARFRIDSGTKVIAANGG